MKLQCDKINVTGLMESQCTDDIIVTRTLPGGRNWKPFVKEIEARLIGEYQHCGAVQTGDGPIVNYIKYGLTLRSLDTQLTV